MGHGARYGAHRASQPSPSLNFVPSWLKVRLLTFNDFWERADKSFLIHHACAGSSSRPIAIFVTKCCAGCASGSGAKGEHYQRLFNYSDVKAVKDAPGAMAPYLHGHSPRHPGSYHLPHCYRSGVIEKLPLQARLPTLALKPSRTAFIGLQRGRTDTGSPGWKAKIS
jgi:hypothetical protein